jgi:hypothetical protein
VWQNRRDDDDCNGRTDEIPTQRTLRERSTRSNDQHDQGRGNYGHDAPSRPKLGDRRVKNEQQYAESDEIEYRTHETKRRHEAFYESGVSSPGALDEFVINLIGRNRQLRNVGQKIRQENLRREQRENGRNSDATAILNMLPKFASIVSRTCSRGTALSSLAPPLVSVR